jgi:DNA-binding transcriptional regulator YdaS (Cro superfamily)
MQNLIDFFQGNQSALARALGVSPAYITMCKKGIRQFDDDLVFKAEQITGIPREQIRPKRFGK